MDPLTTQFNARSAWWSIFIAPLLTLLIIDDIAARETRRHDRITRLNRGFNEKARRHSENRYRRQVAIPQPRMAVPRL